MRSALPPILFDHAEAVEIKEAAHRVRRSEKTVRRWVSRYGIGRQAGDRAPIEVCVVALVMVEHGDFPSLELLRAGRRDAPEVQRYLNHLGLPT